MWNEGAGFNCLSLKHCDTPGHVRHLQGDNRYDAGPVGNLELSGALAQLIHVHSLTHVPWERRQQSAGQEFVISETHQKRKEHQAGRSRIYRCMWPPLEAKGGMLCTGASVLGWDQLRENGQGIHNHLSFVSNLYNEMLIINWKKHWAKC